MQHIPSVVSIHPSIPSSAEAEHKENYTTPDGYGCDILPGWLLIIFGSNTKRNANQAEKEGHGPPQSLSRWRLIAGQNVPPKPFHPQSIAPHVLVRVRLPTCNSSCRCSLFAGYNVVSFRTIEMELDSTLYLADNLCTRPRKSGLRRFMLIIVLLGMCMKWEILPRFESNQDR